MECFDVTKNKFVKQIEVPYYDGITYSFELTNSIENPYFFNERLLSMFGSNKDFDDFRRKHKTLCPKATATFTKWKPKNPVAPVTKILISQHIYLSVQHKCNKHRRLDISYTNQQPSSYTDQYPCEAPNLT